MRLRQFNSASDSCQPTMKKGTAMAVTQSHTWFDSNQYSAGLGCEYCHATAAHERWCITQNLEVLRAWQPVLDPSRLSFHDELILHALGVAWIAQGEVQGFWRSAG
jgi:hypothetical protein